MMPQTRFSQFLSSLIWCSSRAHTHGSWTCWCRGENGGKQQKQQQRTHACERSLSEWMQRRFRWYIRNKMGNATNECGMNVCEWVNAFFRFPFCSRLRFRSFFSRSTRCTRAASANGHFYLHICDSLSLDRLFSGLVSSLVVGERSEWENWCPTDVFVRQTQYDEEMNGKVKAVGLLHEWNRINPDLWEWTLGLCHSKNAVRPRYADWSNDYCSTNSLIQFFN